MYRQIAVIFSSGKSQDEFDKDVVELVKKHEGYRDSACFRRNEGESLSDFYNRVLADRAQGINYRSIHENLA